MAKIDVIMPQMGESIAEGTLSSWIKKAGETVKRDEPIFEISTDKVDAEIPSPAAGVLAEILVNEGETVAVQTVVARIETEAGAAASAPPPAAAAPTPPATPAPSKPAPAPQPHQRLKPRGEAAHATVGSAPARAPQPAAAARPAADATGDNGDNGGAETLEDRLRRRSTPLVRKMAAEHDVDLSAIRGTGLAGRVTKNDILNFLESGQVAAEAPRVCAAHAATDRSVCAGRTRGRRARTAHAPSGVEPWAGDRVEPMVKMRALTAEHMVMSRHISAHVNTIFEIDYHPRRAASGPRPRRTTPLAGVNLTYLAVHRQSGRRRAAQAPGRQLGRRAATSTIFRRTSIWASRSRSTGGSSSRW